MPPVKTKASNKVTSDVRVVAARIRHPATDTREVVFQAFTKIPTKGGQKNINAQGTTESEALALLRQRVAEELAWQALEPQYPKNLSVMW